ncbi:hypothetical protein BGY98DRAFT_201201 [Russula aff. rugulosa BPL654]|nr:hypothetical protein BGY98DRAFT_201201 [Russula aff. rugulosa BPL654]
MVQAQTRSVGVWSVVLVTGRSASCHSTVSVLSLHPTSAAQQRLFVHTQISLCNYPLALSLILCKRRITSISQQHFHNQRVCCDHQFTDRCSKRESPTAHQLTSPAGPRPTALRAGPCTQQSHPHSAHLVRSTESGHITSPANHWPYSTRSQAPRLRFKGT